MNLLKGNINMVNEILDTLKSRDELRDNETCIEIMKVLKTGAPKLSKLIEDTENDDVMAILLLVNDDLNFTFNRFKQVKEGRHADTFVPGECRMQVHFLVPNHVYMQSLNSIEQEHRQAVENKN
jgi:hypothetical protein